MNTMKTTLIMVLYPCIKRTDSKCAGKLKDVLFAEKPRRYIRSREKESPHALGCSVPEVPCLGIPYSVWCKDRACPVEIIGYSRVYIG